ncbi:hypothetical protein CYMTET_19145 [Cymbomonas tetramitiformis]|uniref:Aminotransferase n=1 Tax=Cymbomonas tetramitiformis TaxID=36881 RepID=A0AAE0L5I9_9CHLO|nr:hypothetical protein CYMTET_19145 [Cymbomonas tetramitiformis]
MAWRYNLARQATAMVRCGVQKYAQPVQQQALLPVSVRNMSTNKTRDIDYQIHSQADLRFHESTGSIVMTKGDGIYVIDEQGNRYIEGMAGLWCTGLGFSEPRLAQAAYDQMMTLPQYHTFGNKAHNKCIDLAEKLVQVMPTCGKSPLNKVYFGSGGGDSNDTAIKIIWNYFNAIGKPEKKKLIGRVRGYHGSTVVTTSIGAQPGMHQPFDCPYGDRFVHTNVPHHYTFGKDGETEEDFATRMADDLEKLILAEGPDTVAAMFAEPLQGAGGVVIPPATYWEKMQTVLEKYNVMLVSDEVITGFARTGNMWGCETYGMRPDLLTCAKQLSSGYLPISAVVVGQHVYDAIADFSQKNGVFGHGYTYSGHPVSAAVALETIQIYEERDIVNSVRALSVPFVNGLTDLLDHPLVGEARGVGLVGVVQLIADKETKKAFHPSVKAGMKVFTACEEHGLIPRVTPPGDRLAFCPPMIITEEEIKDMLGRFRKALDSVEPALRAAQADYEANNE